MITGMLRRFLIILMILMCSGCYAEVTGVVVDAETGQPIEGAVVLVEWTITKGFPGMTYTESYKVVELVSDKEGKVTLPEGRLNPFAAPPDVTVYKRGYVAWNNHFIFPNFRERTDYKWQEGFVFRLEIFRAEYSHYKHVIFINSAIHSGMALGQKNLMKSATQWERFKALEEDPKR